MNQLETGMFIMLFMRFIVLFCAIFTTSNWIRKLCKGMYDENGTIVMQGILWTFYFALVFFTSK